MANTTLTADVVAKEALVMLENELGVLDLLYRAPESEFSSEVNGYKKGASVRIRRPADFTMRTGATMNLQDAIEGYKTFTVDQQVGVDFSFTSTDLTLSVSQLSERFIKPAMSVIANGITKDCFEQFYKGVYNWVGTPANAIDSFADFAKMPERMDLMAIPQADRSAALHPTDHWGLLGSQTALYITDAAKGAYRDGRLGSIGGVETMMSQVLPTHTVGPLGGSPTTSGTSYATTYDTAKNTWTQALATKGWTSAAGNRLKAGDVFTIADCYMVNPKTKAATAVLQQFVVMADFDSASNGTGDVTISPPIITSGPHQTVSHTPTDGKALTVVGTAGTAYRQNLFFHKNSFGLAVVPLEMPEGAYRGSRQSYKGLSVRVIPIYDGVNDVSKWRLDLLYGRAVLDPRLAVRGNGS